MEIFDELDAQIAGVDLEHADEIEEERQADVPQANPDKVGPTGEQPAEIEEARPEGLITLYVVGILFALLTLLIDLIAWVFGIKME